jgi:SAM-dependent methyltransferase
MVGMQIELRQRGRASIDFLAALGRVTAGEKQALSLSIQTRGLLFDDPTESFVCRRERFSRTLSDAPRFDTFRALREWSATRHGKIAMEAFDEVRSDVAPKLDRLLTGSTTLEATLGDRLPDYHRNVAFHRTATWDGHDYMGVVHGEIIHRRLVGRNFGGDIYQQRRSALLSLRHSTYAEILELGTSSGNFTVALAQQFPRANITGIDLSQRMLEQAQRAGNERGASWRLYQRAAETTGFADQSFDLVAAYSLGHEVPAAIMRAILIEAARVLRPGGEYLMGDVIPYAAQDPLTQCWADYDAQNGGEPYWREFCTLDLALLALEVGFETANYDFAVGPRRFPYVLHAVKRGGIVR